MIQNKGTDGVLAVQVIPPRGSSDRDVSSLETVAQGLALDEHHPVALEIASTQQGRIFVLRATTSTALYHVIEQFQARYLQATIQPLSSDPLKLQPGEAVSVIELSPGAASYLPLRTWRDRELQNAGTDPLLGLLGALSHVPWNMRVVAQLSILPIAPTWSKPHRRLAVEHPLEQERQQRQAVQRRQTNAPSTEGIVGMGALVVVLLLWMRFKSKAPPWLLSALTQLLHGHVPHLTLPEMLIISLPLLAIASMLLVGRLVLMGRQNTIYDMRAVAEKTGKSAYRARLRLFVIQSPPPAPDTEIDSLPLVYSHDTLSFPIGPGYLKSVVEYLKIVGLPAAYLHWKRNLDWRRGQVERRFDVLERLAGAYRQYNTASGGYFVPKRLSSRRGRQLLAHRQQPLQRWRTGWDCDITRSQQVFSVTDIGMLFHLPQSTDLADLPFVERGRARTFLVPYALTTGNGRKIGESFHAGQHQNVYMPLAELRHNFMAIASTGKGKSTLLQHLGQALLSVAPPPDKDWDPYAHDTDRIGLLVAEPHREMIDAILGVIPPWLRDSVVLIDLANRNFPPGINPIDATLGRDRDKAVDNVIVTLKEMNRNSWGPRTENVAEYAIKTLADANVTLVEQDPQNGPDMQFTLLDVVPLLRHLSFRHDVMDLVRDPFLKNWWLYYYEPMDPRQQTEVISSVVNKMSKFASSRVSRRILGQPRSTINMTQIIRQRQILLISTAAGVVGSDLSTLLGSLLIGLFHITLAEQSDRNKEERNPFLALIDEFQVYKGVDWNTMVAELRKSGGSFGLATQSLSYLETIDKSLRASLLTNIDHLFAFAMDAEDARHVKLEGVEPEDIVNLDNYMCYVRAQLGTQRLPVFSMTLDPPELGDPVGARNIREHSQQRDARPVADVDEMLARGLDRSSPSDQRKQEDNTSHDEESQPTNESKKRHPPKGKNAKNQADASQGGNGTPSEGSSRPAYSEGNPPPAWGKEETEDEG